MTERDGYNESGKFGENDEFGKMDGEILSNLPFLLLRAFLDIACK